MYNIYNNIENEFLIFTKVKLNECFVNYFNILNCVRKMLCNITHSK